MRNYIIIYHLCMLFVFFYFLFSPAKAAKRAPASSLRALRGRRIGASGRTLFSQKSGRIIVGGGGGFNSWIVKRGN